MHRAGKQHPRKRLKAHGHPAAHPPRGQLGLEHLGHQPERPHIGEGEERRARLHQQARLGQPLAHRAADGRVHHSLAQLLFELHYLRGGILHVQAAIFQLILGGVAALGQLLAAGIELGFVQGGAGGGQALAHGGGIEVQ